MARRLLLSFLLPLLLLASPALRAAGLSVGLAADVSSLDPHYLNAAPNIAVASHFFETLVAVDKDGQLVPGLAQSWQAINPTTWEFKLRPGVKFHDGSPLTAEDVVFSLDRPASLTQSPGPFTGFTRAISGKKVVDAHTLRLTTAQPYGPLPLDLASIFIVSKKAAAKATTEDFNSGKALVGTGPFRLVKFRRGEAVELARFDGYWGEKPAWDTLTLRILPADAARLAALLAGQVDMIEGVPGADVARLKKDARFRLEQRVSWRTLFLQLDLFRDTSPFVTDLAGKPLAKNPLKDLKVRQALSRAINREALSARTLDGLGVPASRLVAPGIPGHGQQPAAEPYDPEGAKRLLAEAGYPQGFALTLHGPNNRYLNDEQILQTLAQFFGRIGVKTKVETLPLAAYFGRLRHADFSAALLGWGSLSGDFALRTLLGTPDEKSGWGAWNWGRFSDARVDAEIRSALASTDPARRSRAAEAAMDQAMQQLPVIPLHHQVATWALRAGLTYPARIDEFTFAAQVRPR